MGRMLRFGDGTVCWNAQMVMVVLLEEEGNPSQSPPGATCGLDFN